MASRFMQAKMIQARAFNAADIARDSHVTEAQRLMIRLHPNDYTGLPIFRDTTRDGNRDRSTKTEARTGEVCPTCFTVKPIAESAHVCW